LHQFSCVRFTVAAGVFSPVDGEAEMRPVRDVADRRGANIGAALG